MKSSHQLLIIIIAIIFDRRFCLVTYHRNLQQHANIPDHVSCPKGIEVNGQNRLPQQVKRSLMKGISPFRIFLLSIAAASGLIWFSDSIILGSPQSISHYGTYCGPGPDRSVNTRPLDALDSICKDHDIEYSLCMPETDGIASQKVNSFPRYMNQLISIRGKLPMPISKELSTMFPVYTSCIHRADAKLVRKVTALISRDGILLRNSPPLLSKPDSEAPQEPNICLIGIKMNTESTCLVTAGTIVSLAALDLFQADLLADAANLDI